MKKYPAIWCVVLFILGIIIYHFTGVNLQNYIFYFLLLIITFTFAVINFSKKSSKTTFYLSISLFIILTGIFIPAFQKPDYNYLPDSIIIQKDFKAAGKIIGIDLMKKEEVDFSIETDSVCFNNSKWEKRFNLICRVRDTSRANLYQLYNNIFPGNKIEISGTFVRGRGQRNPGEFNYDRYLHEHGISGAVVANSVYDIKITDKSGSLFGAAVFNIRKAIDRQISRLYNENNAAFIRGQLLAERNNIEYDTRVEFINSGVAHILAVSGLHVGFIVLIILVLFGRFNLYLRSALMLTGLAAFMIITNSPASVIRASIMAGVIVVGFVSNRSSNIFNSLAVAALIILLLKPEQLFDAGFQLSFSAVLSIAVIYPVFQKIINSSEIKFKIIKNILLYAGVSISAQIGTMPVTLSYFGKLSLVSLFTNLIVIPLDGIIVALSILTLIINVAAPVLAFYYASINGLLTSLIYLVIHFAGTFRYAFLWVRDFSLQDSLIFYFLLLLVLFSIKYFRSKLAKLVVAVLSVLNILVFCSIDDRNLFPDSKFSLMMIDVGQGDSFLVKFPGGETTLIDAGLTTYNYDNGKSVILPLLNYLNIDKIDYGFISHIDLDHYGGYVSLINENIIGKIFKPNIDSSFDKDLRFERFVRSKKIPFEYYEKKIIKLKEGRIYVLNFLNENKKLTSNNKSGVLKFVYGRTSLLFTGDMEKKIERLYVNRFGKCLQSDILKVSHHGSKTGSSTEFITSVKPKISLISAGVQNRFGHPAAETVSKLKLIGSRIFRTDKSGGVLFSSDGDSIFAVDWQK